MAILCVEICKWLSILPFLKDDGSTKYNSLNIAKASYWIVVKDKFEQ